MKVALAVGLAAIVALALGCSSVDPTDPSHFTDVLIHNDTPSAVQLVQCDNSCAMLHDRQTVPAGASAIVNVSNEDIRVGYVVERASGARLGCLYMHFNGVRTRPTVEVSTFGRCR